MIVVFVDGDLDNEVKRQIIKRNVRRSLRNAGIISFADDEELETRDILNFINNRNKVFLSHHNYEELADEVLLTSNIVAFAYCEVPVHKKYIYHNAVAQQLQQYDEIGKEDCRLYSGERKERDEPDDFRFGS